MKNTFKFFYVVLICGLIACGGGDDPSSVDCAEGTMVDEDAGECVPEPVDCKEGETYSEEHGVCVPSGEELCAEGTQFDGEKCVADAMLECGENTAEEDGGCVVDVHRECGEGTVVSDGQCVPDDICDDGTADVSDDEDPTFCLPIDDGCGEGTDFDVASRKCIPASDITCGVGTTNDGGFCVPTFGFYTDLADDPDLDMTADDASGEITLADTGDLFSFIGNIDAPQEVDGEWVQDEDVFTLDADAGQWLRISIFSLGLPEPGFSLSGDNDFYRLSDVGAGIEVTREVIIPDTGSFELKVSNLPQMLGDLSPAGADDWNYVGYVETMDTPDADSVDIFDETISGDIRDLTSNYYAVDDMEDVDDVQMLFGSIPHDADGEVQVWSDATTLEQTLDLDELSLSIVPPADSFYLVFDRAHAYGPSTSYSFAAVEAAPLDDGDSLSEDITLDAGDYVGVLQYNTDGHPLSASITDDNSTILASTSDLAVSIADEGQTSLYYYAKDATSVTVEIENSTGQDLDSVSYDIDTGTADAVDVDDGDLQEHDFDSPLSRGQRHYYELAISFDDLMSIYIEDTSTDALLSLSDDSDETVIEELNSIVFDADPQDYLLYVEAQGGMGSGFTLAIEESQIFDLSETSSPGTSIPDNVAAGIDDTITMATCPSVSEIDMDVDIPHTYRGDLTVRLTDPEGTEHVLKSRYGGTTEDIIGNFNDTLGANNSTFGSTAVPIDEFEDTTGTGDWTLNVSDNAGGDLGTLESWTLNLTCEG